MKKSLVIIMSFLVGALVYGELFGNNDKNTQESYLVDNIEEDDDDMTPTSFEYEPCDCREEEADECTDEACGCECHEQIELE